MVTKRRQKANAFNKKVRKAIQKATGKKLPKAIEIDHKKSVKKGGAVASLKNIQLLLRKANRKKGPK